MLTPAERLTWTEALLEWMCIFEHTERQVMLWDAGYNGYW